MRLKWSKGILGGRICYKNTNLVLLKACPLIISSSSLEGWNLQFKMTEN
jgi:hypothetical protein